MQIQDYWAVGNNDSAMALLDSIPVRYDLSPLQDSAYQTFRTLMQFKQSFRNDSVSITHLDTTRVVQLDSIAHSGHGLGMHSARNNLNSFYGYNYAVKFETPSAPGGYRMTRTENVDVNSAASLKTSAYIRVYPNPAISQETFEFKLPCDNAEGFLVVADMTGHGMASAIVGSDATQKIIDIRSRANGVYLYRLTCNDKVVGTGKFEVMK
ncbi:MAG: hypothetical protein JWO06_243 [Bacteroidota bacterium]|nr:hypothetical protein [Bacteroidota bacterium]